MKNFTRAFTNKKSKLNIKGLLTLFVLLLTMQTGWGQSISNGGFESNTTYPGTGWTGVGSYTSGGSIPNTGGRTGSNYLVAPSVTNPTAYSNYFQTTSSINVPTNSYLHFICWAKTTSTTSTTKIWIGEKISSITNTLVQSPTTFTQFSVSIKNTGSATTGLSSANAYPAVGLNTNASSRVLWVDDAVAYVDNVLATDLTKPVAPTLFTNGTISSSSVGFSWTAGSDAGTGIQNTIILRTTNSSAVTPVMNDQGIYSTTGTTSGPNTVSTDWTVLSTTVGASTLSYTDTSVTSGTSYKYAVIHRDLAFNYSTALVSGTIIASSSCTSPSTQASSLTANTTTTTTSNYAFTRGNGNNVLVVARLNSTAAVDPTSGTSYTANAAFTSGNTTGTGNYVVYNGTAAGTGTATGNIAITGLTAGSNYTLTAYEYSTTGTCYNTTSPASSSFYTLSTAPAGNPASFTAAATSSTAVGLSFSAANTITSAYGYLIIQKPGGTAATFIPTNGTAYTTASTLSDGSVAAVIASTSATSQAISSLTANTQYTYTIVPYSYDGTNAATLNYYTTSNTTATATTLATAPTIAAVTNQTVDNNFNITFTDNATWRAAVTGITVDGTSYTTNYTFGFGTLALTTSAITQLQTAGSHTIVVIASGYANASVTQTNIAGIPAAITMTTQPVVGATSGAALATMPKVTVKDQYANVISGSVVTAAVTSGQESSWTLGGASQTATTNASGVATFTTLTATNTTSPSVPYSTASLTFAPGTGSGSVTSSTFTIKGIAPTITAASGATVDTAFDATFTDNATWRAAITGITVGGTALTAGYSAATAGKITFTPSLSSTSTLLQSAEINKSIVVTATNYPTTTFLQTIGAGADYKLVITTQPTAPASNGAVLAAQPVVKIQDQYGNATTSTATIVAAVGSGSWTLGGTTSVAGVSGTTTFSGLTATSVAAVTGATITFSSGSLQSITSNTFNIIAPVIDYVNITTLGTAATENFDSLGLTATGTLPNGFLVSKALGSPASAAWVDLTNNVSVTTRSGGSSGTGAMSTNSAAGIYNFASGSTASATDRALGFLTSGSFPTGTAANNIGLSILSKVKNTTGSSINSLTVAFDYEKYRDGNNVCNWTFYYSSDGTSWTAVSGGDQSFAAETTGGALTSSGPITTSKSTTITGLTIASGSNIYLRWSYDSGGSNAKGIGLDNVSITGKKTTTISISGDQSFTYTGSAQGPSTITYSGDGTTSFLYTNTNGTTYSSNTAPTNVGSYQVVASATASSNYVAVSSSAYTFDITAADSSVTVSGTAPFSYTYNGLGQAPSFTASGSNATITYLYSGTGIIGTTSSTPINVGTYSVTASVVANGNYAAASSSATSFSITAAASSVTVTGSAPFSYTYNGLGQAPSFTASGSTATITYLYSGTGITGTTSSTPINAGTYSVTASVAANGNYGSASSSATAFTIGVGTTTWTSASGGSWSNNAPNLSLNAIISYDYNFAGLTANTLTVNNSAVVVIPSGNNVTLNGALTVSSGSFTLNNNTNLIQTDASAENTGNIIVKRESAKIVRLDHTLWSSPVTGQNLRGFSPLTVPYRFYTYDTTNNQYDATTITDATVFTPAKGFAIRAPNNYQTSPAVEWNGTFTGVPNNGTKTFPLVYASGAANINLVGNPYPSAIDAATFCSVNQSVINGTLYFYQHTLTMNSSGLFGAGTNYGTWTSSGGSTKASVGVNADVSVFPSGIIEVGQGFMVKSTNTGDLTFNNSMRVASATHQFMKSSSTVTTLEKHRMWLNLESATGSDLNQILVGYVTGATEGVDDGYDGLAFGGTGSSLYSPIDARNYVIQCRSLPFNNTDEVPLGFNCTEAGTYSIKLSSVDGLFEGNQDIFIRDNLNGTDTNIKVAPFTFTSDIGTFDNRFKIVYTQALGVPSSTFNENSVIVYKNTDWFHVSTKGISMKDILVYDVSGRLIYKLNDLNDTTAVLKGLTTTKQVLFLKITSTENQSVTVKVLN